MTRFSTFQLQLEEGMPVFFACPMECLRGNGKRFGEVLVALLAYYWMFRYCDYGWSVALCTYRVGFLELVWGCVFFWECQ